MRRLIAWMSLVLCLAAVEIAPALELTVDDSDVRYFVALGTRILEFADGVVEADPEDPLGSGWDEVYRGSNRSEACTEEDVPWDCCTGSMTGTCVDDFPESTAIADLAYMPDGRLYFSVPDSHFVGRIIPEPDAELEEKLFCFEGSCEPTDLGVNYNGDLLAVDARTGGLLAWIEAVALCSDTDSGYSALCYEDVNLSCTAEFMPYGCCTGNGTGSCLSGFLNEGEFVPGSADLGAALTANQEWYTGQMAVIRDAVQGSKKPPKSDPLPAQLLKADNPDYLECLIEPALPQCLPSPTAFPVVRAFDLEGSPTDLTVSQAQAFYTEGKKLWRLDLESGNSFPCESFGNERAEFVTGDVGGVVYVGTANNQDYRVRRVAWDASGCTELELKRFNQNDWDRVAFGGVTTTYSTLATQVTGTPGVTMVTKPDDMHYYRFTPENLDACRVEVTPTLLETALAAIESSVDFNDPSPDVNDRLGLPFNLPGQSHPWQYEILDCEVDDESFESFEFHEFSTAVSGTNFRLACCTDACEPGVYCPQCEWGALIYALPIASEIVPDPRGTRRGTGSACYESLTSTRNSNKPAEFCGWNSPLEPTPPDPFDVDTFFCGPGVYSVTQGDTVPVKFNVGIPDGDCSSNEDLPYYLNVLFSAGVAGRCVGDNFEIFEPLEEVEAILGIEPNGEGEIDPRTGQVKFAKSGPKKQYQFNFNTGQVTLLTGSDPVRTIVLINATFLEDSIEEGDQSIFLAVDP